MAKEVLIVEDIHKIYNSGEIAVEALSGVSLTIYEGDFIAIMGASGSGKSTFLNIIGCLDKATSGNYLIDGVSTNDLNKNQLADIRSTKLGFVFQSYNLLPRTTALENVELPLLYNKKIRAKERKQKALEALRMVGLADRTHHYPNQLSGGQQQRVALARALVNEPKIILADEPTGNLDTKTSIEVMELFCNLNDEGITIVIVTHEKDIAAYTKKNVLFRDGKIISIENVIERNTVFSQTNKLINN